MLKKYHVGDRTVLVVDGDLYEKLLPLDVLPVIPAVPASEPVNIRGKLPKTLNQRLSVIRERKKRNVLGPEAEAAVREEIQNGLGMTEACQKYEISVSTFYRLKNESQSKPVVES